MRQTRRILITDAEQRSVLAAIRGLRRAGFEVDAAAGAGYQPSPGLWSRSVSVRSVVPHPLSDEGGFVDAIERAASGDHYSVLIPGGDASLLAISRSRDRLESHVRLSLPPHAVVERCLDKIALISPASAHDLPPPKTVVCSGATEALEAARTLGLPVVLKPRRSIFMVDGMPRQVTGVIVHNERTLEEVLPRYGDPCLVQRREPGAVLSLGGVFAGGRFLGEALSRYERTWRPEAGSASFSQTIEMPGWLRERAGALLTEMGWEGLFELEFIEREDGDCGAIDFNPRPYGSLALAIAAGANLPAIWCEHLLGGAPEPARARPGVFYRWEDADLRNGMWQLRHRRVRTAAEVLRPRRAVVHPYFQLRDPAPIVARGLVRTTPAARGARPGVVAVIGAGPYGLAAAGHLRAAGAHVRCFGEPLEFWRSQMPDGMVLRSRKRSSHIADPQRKFTIDRYAEAERVAVHEPSLLLNEFIDYGQWFQRRAVPELDRRKVATVTREGRGFRLELEDGEQLSAARVVVAAGLAPFASRPELFASLPRDLVSHSSEHTDLGMFAGRRVAVVGAGQSALESAALLSESGASVEVLARSPAIRWLDADDPSADDDRVSVRGTLRKCRTRLCPPTDVGGLATGWVAAAPDVFRRVPEGLQPVVSYRCIRPAGAAWLMPRLADVTISCERHTVAAQSAPGGVRLVLDDGSERSVDHVLLATGYSVDVTRYRFLATELVAEIERIGGYPVLGPGLESSVAALHFLGAPTALSFGPIMRFVVGTWYAAPALTRRALGRLQPPIRFSF